MEPKPKKLHTSTYLFPAQSKRLQAIAASLGLYQTRGVGAGTVGSISQLMQAIAEGEVIPHRADAALVIAAHADSFDAWVRATRANEDITRRALEHIIEQERGQKSRRGKRENKE